MAHISGSSVGIKGGCMKNMNWLVFSLVLLSFGSLSADTITSVPNGGIWSAAATWVGDAIPSANSDVVINGAVSITSPASCRSLTISDSAAILQNGGAAKHVTLAITGPITNNGTLRNNPDSLELWLLLSGDVTNNGTWNPARTFFALKDTQTIAQSPESEFGGALFASDTAGLAGHFPLVAASDLTINARTFDCLGHATSEEWQGKVDMAQFKLTLLGSTKLTGASISNTTEVNWADSSSVSNCSFESAITISGICTVTDSKVMFNNEAMIFGGTLQNGDTLESTVVVRFKGNVVNMGGAFRNNENGKQLWLEMYGDLYNAGLWKPARTYIASRKTQAISMIAQSPFDGNFYTMAADSSTDTFPLIATSDLKFYGKEFGCHKRINNLVMQGKFDMGEYNLLIQNGAYLYGAEFSNTQKVTCIDSSMIGECTFQDPVQACGRFKIALQGMYFNDTLTVTDTLENGVGGCCIAQGMLFARKGIVNNGLIRDNPKEYELWCTISGNIVNSGVWKNKKNVFTDSIEQTITLGNGKPINAFFQFDGMWASGPYAWEKDNQTIANGTIRFLDMDSLVASSAGVYRCKKSAEISRPITVVWEGAGVRDPGKLTQGTPSAFGCDIVSRIAPVVRFWTPYACGYSISLYDIQGRLVASIASHVASGYHSIAIPRQGVGAGTYTVTLRAAHFEKSMRVAIVR
jgi:hypothetical protein